MKTLVLFFCIWMFGPTGVFASDEIKAKLDPLVIRAGQIFSDSELEEWDTLHTVIGWKETASSSLKGYGPENANDGNAKTAWVEGAEGDGLGESIVFNFVGPSAKHGRTIIKIIRIVNGYAKNPKIWAGNSRVKTLKLLKNGEPLFLITLEDSPNIQDVDFKEKAVEIANGDQLQFQIVDVFRGTKWSDTAISEILFSD